MVEGKLNYPLRPEVVESIYKLYRATDNTNLLHLGFEYLDRLEEITRVKCGFANVQNVTSGELEDKMESFFLAETLKYLYLLFTPSSIYNTEKYIFTTEAHPFPVWSSGSLFEKEDDPDVVRDFNFKYDEDFDSVVEGWKKKICLRKDWLAGRSVRTEVSWTKKKNATT